MRAINILGQDYEIVVQKEHENPKLKSTNGICEIYEKKIVLCDFEIDPENTVNCPDLYRRQVMRHEIIHAFLFESGLSVNSDWARNEEMVDFFAIQIPKIFKVMATVDSIGGNP